MDLLEDGGEGLKFCCAGSLHTTLIQGTRYPGIIGLKDQKASNKRAPNNAKIVVKTQ